MELKSPGFGATWTIFSAVIAADRERQRKGGSEESGSLGMGHAHSNRSENSSQ